MTFIDFLNKNAGAIQTLFAGAVTVATIVYVCLTRRMWQEMRLTNERVDQPNVIVALERGRSFGSLFDLWIRNSGDVPVYEVVLDFSPKDLPGLMDGVVGNTGLFSAPIPVLTRGQELRTAILNLIEVNQAGKADTTMTFSVSYKTSRGKPITQTYCYNLKVFMGLIHADGKDIDDVATQMEKLADAASRIPRELEYLKDRCELSVTLAGRSAGQVRLLAGLLRTYLAAWADADSIGDFRFLTPNLVRTRVLCSDLYLSLCAQDHPADGHRKLRCLLLKMLNHRFYGDGGASCREFLALGKEAAAIAKQMLESGSTPTQAVPSVCAAKDSVPAQSSAAASPGSDNDGHPCSQQPGARTTEMQHTQAKKEPSPPMMAKPTLDGQWKKNGKPSCPQPPLQSGNAPTDTKATR
jgi:hypothetical protein